MADDGPWNKFKKQPAAGDGPWTQFQKPNAETQAAFGEMSAMTQDPGLAAREKMKAAYEASPWYKKAAIDAFDVPNLVAEGGSAHLLDKGVAAARAPFTDLTYDEELAKQREHVKQAQARQGPVLSTVADITGAMALPAARGGNLAFRLGTGVAEGAGYGAARSYADDQDVGTGALQGAGWGALGQGVGEGVNVLAHGAGMAKNALKDPAFRQEVWNTGRDAIIGGMASYIHPYLGMLGAGGGTLKNALPLAKAGYAAAQGAPATAGAPGTRDVLSRLIARSGIWGTAD